MFIIFTILSNFYILVVMLYFVTFYGKKAYHQEFLQFFESKVWV